MQRMILHGSRFLVFATLFGLTLPLIGPPVQAQAPETTHTALYQALAGLRPGTLVRASQAVSVFQGTLRRLTRHDVVLLVNRAERTLSLDEVDTLWVSRQGRAGKGALIGGLAGLGIGLLAGAIAAPEFSDTPASAYAALGGVTGLLGGATLGLLGGSQVYYWDRTYPKATD
jgi:hypothetical protein